jgi:hypothetical protein
MPAPSDDGASGAQSVRLSALRHAVINARGAAEDAIGGALHGASAKLSAIGIDGIATSALAAVTVESFIAIAVVVEEAAPVATCAGIVERSAAWPPQPRSAVAAQSMCTEMIFVMAVG